MSYPAGAPLPSSKIILIILDGNMSDGIVPEYLENKFLSKSFVKIISLFLEKFSTVENLSKNRYVVLKNSSLRQALIETLNTNINLISIPEPNTIPELRDIIEQNARVEAFKIINNNYGIRWLIWGGENLYYAFMWNSSTSLKITKIG